MEQKNNKIYIVLLLVFFIIFAGSGLTMLFFSGQKPKEGAVSTNRSLVTLPTVAPREGSLKLQLVGNRFSVNQTVTVQLVADSNKENIVGWDGLLSFNPAEFEFISAQSTVADFKIYPYKRDGYVVLTGVKSLQSSASTIWKETAVATVTLQPKKVGAAKVSLEGEIGKEKTDFVNTTTKVIYPQLNSLSLEIY